MEESRPLPDHMTDGNTWPRITVVTPSFNQGQYIEETIRSVLLQGYPNLEYFILDGGSTDHSVEIIKKYSPWLNDWVSEPDSGQSSAINRGLMMGSGVFATWINSDDMLCKDALGHHALRIGFSTNVVYVGNCLYMDENGRVIFEHRGRVKNIEDLVRIKTVWRSSGQIVQPEVLFPRDLALAVGGVNADNHFTMDFELWGMLLLAKASFQYTKIPFGMFRKHANQKINNGFQTTQSIIDTATKLVNLSDSFSEAVKKDIIVELADYQKEYWKQTGRLSRIGLPPQIVTPLRSLIAKLR